MQSYNQLKTINTAVILAGGRGARLSEQTNEIPKPLIRVGDKPIIVHIMRKLAVHGVKNFYILGGYLVDKIYKYFIDNSSIKNSLQLNGKEMSGLRFNDEVLGDCNITILDTGLESQTAERVRQVQDLVKGNFILTYGDTYSDVDITEVEKKILNNQNILSLCAVPYFARFGLLKIENEDKVTEFKEKSESKDYFINGGFLCVKQELFSLIKETDKDFSKDTMESEDLKNKIGAFVYRGYWKAVDTQRDWEEINEDYKNRHIFV